MQPINNPLPIIINHFKLKTTEVPILDQKEHLTEINLNKKVIDVTGQKVHWTGLGTQGETLIIKSEELVASSSGQE